jgi:hypothetical protein
MSNDSGLGCANKVCWSILKTTIDITYALSERKKVSKRQQKRILICTYIFFKRV